MILKMMPYELEDSIDNLMIEFKPQDKKSRYYGEIDTPEDSEAMIRQKTDKEGNIYYIDIVDPQAFMEESWSDDFEVEGVNIKQLIRDNIDNIEY